MKVLLKNLLAICLFIGFVSCSEQGLDTYSGKEYIYFKKAIEEDNSKKVYDSISVSFAYDLPSVTDSIYHIPVKVQGFVKSYDREINVQVDQSATAIQGTNFELINTPYYIPAGENIGMVSVKLKRTPELRENELVFAINIVPNEHFDVGILTSRTSGNNENRVVNPDKFQISFSDILVEPSNWRILQGWLGPYSQKKLYLLAEVNEIPVPNYNTLPNIGTFLTHIAVLKAYLIEQKAAGNTVYEDDGTEMVLGPYA